MPREMLNWLSRLWHWRLLRRLKSIMVATNEILASAPLSGQFEISECQIYAILNGKRWKHIPTQMEA